MQRHLSSRPSGCLSLPLLPYGLPGFLHHSPSHLSQPVHMKVAERDWERSAGGPAAAGSALSLCL